MWWRRLAEVQTEHIQYIFKKTADLLGLRTWTHGSILPCLNGSGWCWWCNGVWDIFLAHFGPLSTNWALFKRHSLPEYCCWPCPSLYDYSVPIFWCYFQQDNAPCHQSSNHLRLVSWTWQWVHFTQTASTVTRSQSNRAPLGCGVKREIHIMDVQPTNLQQLCDAIMSIWTKISEECLQTPCWIYATKN